MNLKEKFTRKIKKYNAVVMVKTLKAYFSSEMNEFERKIY